MFNFAAGLFSRKKTPIDEFKDIWKSLAACLVKYKDDSRISAGETELPGGISRLLELLCAEEVTATECTETDLSSSSRPCLDFLIQQQILDTLSVLAHADRPGGIKEEVLVFFTKILTRISQPLIPHVNVYRPMQRLIRLCGETRAGPTEESEVLFLSVVCSILKRYPMWSSLFIERSEENQVLPMVDSLMCLIQTPDRRVSIKACEALLLLMSVAERKTEMTLCNHSSLLTGLVNQLCKLYMNLPADSLQVDVIRDTTAKWGLDHASAGRSGRSGDAELVSLLAWLDYYDQLAQSAVPSVAHQLAAHLLQQFLSGVLLVDLMQPSESGVVFATHILNKFILSISSETLNKAMHEFLCRDSEDFSFKVPSRTHSPNHRSQSVGSAKEFDIGKPESARVSVSSGQPQLLPIHPDCVLSTLCDRFSHLNYEVAVASLRVFESLLSRTEQTETVISFLILPIISQKDVVPTTKKELESEDVPTGEDLRKFYTSIVKEPIAAEKPSIDSSFEMYLLDARTQMKTVEREFYGETSETDEVKDTFMANLMKCVSQFLSNTLQMNLAISAVLYRCSLLANRHVFDAIFNSSNSKALAPSLLSKLSADITGRSDSEADFDRQMNELRSAIHGQLPPPSRSGFKARLGQMQRVGVSSIPAWYQDSSLVCAVLILEEMCKAIGAATVAQSDNRR